MEDPDAPRGTFTHWVLFNLPPRIRQIAAGEMPAEARVGRNDWGEPRYGGPRPPDREHRYYFRLYALDAELQLPGGSSRREVELALEGHVIANAELMGRYAPSRLSANV